MSMEPCVCSLCLRDSAVARLSQEPERKAPSPERRREPPKPVKEEKKSRCGPAARESVSGSMHQL